MKKALQILNDTKQLLAKKVLAADALKIKQDEYDSAVADVATYQFRLDQTVAYAPSDGYAVKFPLFLRLKILSTLWSI